MKGVGFGIVPEYRSKGINSLMVDKLASDYVMEKYDMLYLPTIRAHNHKAVPVYEKLGTAPGRIHVTYRKKIDDSITITPFEFTIKDY